ncbi:hypothetical protein SLEP1_g30941 [Rubroshorea leprosula]|uniref:Uncharacterized protein n=1 Tax=Rubroshorea leprosula TaxID=152421 RepID=A0AAV5K9P0_9ROSI|nr:hypothetical protein SLEP1_g30941 [Rubroshorea leprosula]
MEGTRETRNGGLRRGSKLKKRTLRRMKAKAVVAKLETIRVREETAGMVTAMGDLKLEIDLLKLALGQHSEDMLLISEAVNTVTQIILQL